MTAEDMIVRVLAVAMYESYVRTQGPINAGAIPDWRILSSDRKGYWINEALKDIEG
jgi:hypothetical protein